MKKIITGVLFLVGVSSFSFGYQHNMPNLRTASTLMPNQIVLDIDHRFGGALTDDPFNTWLGLSGGASVGLGMRYGLNEEMHSEVIADLRLHDTTTSQSEVELGYSQDLLYVWDTPARLQGQVSYFSIKNLNTGVRDGNVYYLLALQPKKALLDKWTPVLNLGYDGFSSGNTLALGMEYALNESWSLTGEVIQANMKGRDGVWSLGVKMQTYGHNFIVMVQNSSDVGLRTLSRGTTEKDMYLGFKIQRLIDGDGLWIHKRAK